MSKKAASARMRRTMDKRVVSFYRNQNEYIRRTRSGGQRNLAETVWTCPEEGL